MKAYAMCPLPADMEVVVVGVEEVVELFPDSVFAEHRLVGGVELRPWPRNEDAAAAKPLSRSSDASEKEVHAIAGRSPTDEKMSSGAW